ncbi:MAG: hypothetical protein QOI90_489, partial [Mycobacterium sp.]|nr:hypothetical protein [Mycobacterium sp.]
VGDDRLLLVLGVVIGIAGMAKFQVMLLCLVLLEAVAICDRGTYSADRCSGRGWRSRR